MRNLLAAACAATCLISATAARAEGGRLSLSATAGTLGIGPEVGYRFSPNVGVRANGTLLSIGHSLEVDDIAYDGDLALQSGGAVIDVYPFGGSFRLSGGARFNRNRVDVTATPMTNVTVGDLVATPEQIGELVGEAHVRTFAPIATLGWAGELRRGLRLNLEIGALFQGAIKLRNFRSEGGTLSEEPAFQAEIEKERVRVESDLSKYKVHPVLQLALAYRF